MVEVLVMLRTNQSWVDDDVVNTKLGVEQWRMWRGFWPGRANGHFHGLAED